MYFSSYRGKTLLKKWLGNLVEILDYEPNHPLRYLRRQSAEDTGAFVAEHMLTALAFYSERDLLLWAVDQAPAGLVLEFGVFRGGSARTIARAIGPSRVIHGFDSFEGLPEDWTGGQIGKGAFSLGGRLPKVPSNCRLHKGWYDKSLPGWLADNPGSVALAHIDCDLYTSTKIVFDLLASRLVSGTILVFDEYFNYPNWRQHEHKAFMELVEAHSLAFDYIAYSHSQVVVRIR